MEPSETGDIGMFAFMGLCINEARKTSVEKADWIVLIVGAFLGPIALLIPSLETRVTHLLLVAPISALCSVAIVRIFLSPLLVYRKRETAARTTESELRAAIASHTETIRERDEQIRVLTQKPKRSLAEQHAHDIVQDALKVTKQDGINALRYLKYQGKFTVGTYASQPPSGMTLDRTLWVYNHCHSVGIVNRSSNLGHSEHTYTLSSDPAMVKALDDLLFEK